MKEKEEEEQYAVSDCCLASAETHDRPCRSMVADSPADPITVCSCCGYDCEEWTLSKEEFINEIKKRKEDPAFYGFDAEDEGSKSKAPNHQEKG